MKMSTVWDIHLHEADCSWHKCSFQKSILAHIFQTFPSFIEFIKQILPRTITTKQSKRVVDKPIECNNLLTLKISTRTGVFYIRSENYRF